MIFDRRAIATMNAFCVRNRCACTSRSASDSHHIGGTIAAAYRRCGVRVANATPWDPRTMRRDLPTMWQSKRTAASLARGSVARALLAMANNSKSPAVIHAEQPG